MRYAGIDKCELCNGNDIGVSLFVQGCHFHCRGCFNPETWDFNHGKPWDDKVKDEFLDIINKPYIKRVSILGGEPLCDENVQDVKSLLHEIRTTYPYKKIWVYTGYNFDDIFRDRYSKENEFCNLRYDTICYADVVVDGQFDIQKQDLYNEYIVWAGSTNQRIINVKEFLTNKLCEESLHDNK